MRKVNLGLIGLGRHGIRYANHILKDTKNGRLVAICRRKEAQGKAFAKEKDIKFYNQYRELLKDKDIEAVIIVTTPNMNLDISIESIKAKKHILIEKPFATNLKDAKTIIEEAERETIKLMVAQTLRYNPVISEIKKRKEEIGSIHTISVSQRYESLDREWQREVKVAGGGNVLHLGVHIFDFIRWITGDEVKRVYCETANIFNPELEDSFVAAFNLNKGIKCVIDSCRYTDSRSGRIELVGENGQLIGDFVHYSLAKIKGNEMIPIPTSGDIPTIKKILEDFCDSIVNDRNPPITGYDGLKTIEIADGCYRSARKGKAVYL